MTATPLKLDTSILPEDAQSLFDKLNRRVIGQDRAVKQFVKAYCSIMSGLNKEGRPAGVFLFAGPTGCLINLLTAIRKEKYLMIFYI